MEIEKLINLLEKERELKENALQLVENYKKKLDTAIQISTRRQERIKCLEDKIYTLKNQKYFAWAVAGGISVILLISLIV